MSICLFWLLKHDKAGSARGLLLIVSLFGYSFLLNSDYGLEYWDFNGVLYPPLIRCLSGLSLGVVLFVVQDEYNKKVSHTINLVSEYISYVLIIFTLLGIDCIGATIIGFCGMILNGFYSKNTYETKIIKVITQLGQLSYGAYLFHIATIQIIGVCMRHMGIDLILLRLISSILFAFLLAFFTQKIVIWIKGWSMQKNKKLK